MSNGKWIWGYARKVKGYLVFTTLLLIMEAICIIGITGIQKFIIDELFINRHYYKAFPLLAGLAGLALAYNFLHLFAPLVRNKAMFKLERSLMDDMIKYLHIIPVKLFRNQRTGKYVSNLTDDIPKVSGLISSDIPNGIMAVTSALILSIIIGVASPILLFIILTISLLYIVLGKYYAPRMKQANKDVAEKRTNMIVLIEEGIASSREVIAFHRQDWEMTRFKQRFSEYFTKVMKQVSLDNQQKLFSTPLIWSIRLIVLGYGGYLVMEGKLSIGWFVVVYQFSSQLLEAYQGMYYSFIGIAGNLAFVDRVREVIDGETNPEGSNLLTTRINSLTLENVSFKYESDTKPVLRSINIDIPIGKKVAFVGTSGGGKSTIAQLLIRYYEPDSGSINVNNEALSTINREDWLMRLSIVFQEPYLFPDSIKRNLLLGKEVPDEVIIDVCSKMQIHDFIITLPDGYDTQIGERGIQLSGGQRQRIALARALLMDSDILILDEATSALDLETERQVQLHLDEYRKYKTTIVIAHRLSTIMDADIIYVMDEGQVVEQGSHEDLMCKGPVYQSLVNAN